MNTPGALPPQVMAEIKAGFFVECEELLGELESALLSLRQGGRDAELVNTVFRAAHSIKGGAAMFGLDRLIAFAHRMESTLGAIRSGQTALSAEIIDLLLRAADVLADHVRAARDGGNAASPIDIEHALCKVAPVLADADPSQTEPVDGDVVPDCTDRVLETEWTIRFRPYASLYARANEPLALLRELKRLGPVAVSMDDSELPSLPELGAEEAYLVWTIVLTTARSEEDIRAVFDFVEGYCELEVARTGERLQGSASGPEMAASTVLPFPPAEMRIAAAKPPPQAAAGPSAPAKLGETIRVDLERIDRLVNLASELVINQAMLTQRLTGSGFAAIAAELPLDDIDHLTRELQDSVMAIRAQPVKVVFQRLSRLVRELEAVTGKKISLVTEGEATEVDRTVIERLTDPLTHMIRNAVDHGIETPEQRVAVGKPPHGTIRVVAAHRGGRVVIELSDDGRGLDRERIRATAVARGLISADAALAEHDIDNLIFLPGFSTATTVSEISGRGVGMDVVRSGVQGLGGRIVLESMPGKGSTFILSLPLTLAVLDGMLVSVAGQSLIVPLNSLLETIQPKQGDVRFLGARATLLAIRGEHVPLFDLGSELGYRQGAGSESGVVLLVEDDAGRRAALLVDDVLGQRQVVIKSIQANYRAVDGIAAATILGDGRVALIVDVNAILFSQRGLSAERRAAAG